MKNLAAQDRAHVFGLAETLLDELFFDLVERLAPEVAQREELPLPLVETLTDFLDLIFLEAVESSDREVELFDRRVHQAVLTDGLSATVVLTLLDPEVDGHEQLQVLCEELGGVTDSLLRRHRAVGPDLDDQAVVVGGLTHARLLHHEVRLLDRREDRVDRDDADGLAFPLVALRGNVALAPLDVELHPQVALRGQRAA